MPRRGRLSNAALVVLVLLVGCQAGPEPSANPASSGIASRAPDPSAAASGPRASLPSSAECDAFLPELETAAAAAEASIADGGSSAGLVALLSCLGITVLPGTTDPGTVETAMAGSRPVVSQGLLDGLVGSGPGLLLDLDTLVADLASQGLRMADGAPINRESLDAGVARLATLEGADGAAARILVGLGRARVARTGTDRPDPLWGEARLDAVQFLIVSAAILVSPTATSAIRPSPGETTAGGAIRLASAVGNPGPAGTRPVLNEDPPPYVWNTGIARMLLRPVQAALNTARFGPCIALHLLSTVILADPAPADLWHKNGHDPYKGTVTFSLLRKKLSAADWTNSGCPVPSAAVSRLSGTYEGILGKTVTWETDALADKHGKLSEQRFVSNVSGDVTASYETVPERSARADQVRGNELSEPATITVQIKDLLSDLPGTLVTGPAKSKSITIHWYEPHAYKLLLDFRFVGTNPAFESTIVVRGEMVMRPVEPSDGSGRPRTFAGSEFMAYTTTPHTGVCRFTWEGKGKVQVSAEALAGNPIDVSTFKLTLAFRLSDIPSDLVMATGCPPKEAQLAPESGKLSLLTIFMVETFPQPKDDPLGFHTVIQGWKVSTAPGAILQRDLQSSCSGTCDFRGQLLLQRVQ